MNIKPLVETPPPKEKRKQHYVFRGYIMNFSSNGKTVFYLNKLNHEIKESNGNDICFEKDLYEYKATDGTFFNSNKIENMFAKLEGQFCSLIKKIISICDDPKNENALIASPDEKMMLSLLTYNLISRNPHIRDNFKKEFEKHKSISPYIKYSAESKENRVLWDFIWKQMLIDDKEEVARACYAILQYNLYFFKSNDDIITSSNPVIYISDDDSFFLPISPRYALIWSKKKIGKRANRIIDHRASENKEALDKIKTYYFSSSIDNVRFVIAHQKELLNEWAKYTETEMKQKITINEK